MQIIILLFVLTVASGYLDVAVGSNVGKRDAANADMVISRENATVSSAPKINVGATKKSDAKVQGVVPADAGDARNLAGAQRAKGAKSIEGGQNKILSNKAVAGSDPTLAGTNSTVARGKGKAGVEKVNVKAVTGDQAQDAPVLDQQAAGGNGNNAGDKGKDSQGNGKNAEGNGKNPDGNGKNTGGKTQNAAVAGAGAGATTLNPKAIQSGSATDGSVSATAGQVKSLTDAANFVNFCVEKSSQKGILTNGLQVKAGSCNGIPMGDIPAQNAMVSSMILNPATGQDVVPLTDFNVQVQMNNLAAGVFTNPDATYYAAPQQLVGGKIIGHIHVTIQDLGGTLTPKIAPDAAKFVFFKGINNAGNNQGLLQATVKGGLPAGAYRVCTMAAGANHQPVLMPVAQRGAQDDCTKFTVGGGGGGKTAAGTSVVGNNKAAVAVPAEAAPAQHAAGAQNGSGNANIGGSQDQNQNQHQNQSQSQSQSQRKAAQGKKKGFRFASQRRSRFSARIQIA